MDTEPGLKSLQPERRSRLFFITIAALGLATLLLRMPYYVGILNDDACYVLRAFSLVGRGDCIICGQALTQGRDFALGWPLLLAPLALFAKSHLWVYQGLSLLLTLGSACCLGAVSRKYFGSVVGVLSAGVLLLSQGSLWFATSTMSEPLYLFLICILLALSSLARESNAANLGMGLVVGWCLVTRTEGLAVLAALMVPMLWKRQWHKLRLVLGVAASCFVLVTLLRPRSSPHWGQVLEFFGSGSSFLQYLKGWSQGHLNLLTQCYLGELGSYGTALAMLLTLVALFGCFRWWQKEPGFGPWLALTMPTVLLLWPYFHLRYWYPLLPVWILGLAFGLPLRLRSVGFVVLLAIQLFAAVSTPMQDTRPVVALYQALRETPNGSVVTCQYDCRVHLFSHRPTVHPAGANSLAEFVVFMASQGSDAVVWERVSTLISDVRGERQGRFADNLALGLERSPMFDVVASNTAGVVCLLQTPKEKVIEAFSAYRQAFLEPSPEKSLASLERCLEICPDFPDVKIVWAELASRTEHKDKLKIERFIVEHAETYPHDVAGLLLGLDILKTQRAFNSYERVLELARQDALKLGRADVLQALQGLKGGAREGGERPSP